MTRTRHLMTGALAALALMTPRWAASQDGLTGQTERVWQRADPAELARGLAEEQPENLRLQAGGRIGTTTEEALLGGFVADLSPLASRMTLLDPETGQMRDLEVNENTRLTRQGQRIGLLDLEPGTEVRVSLQRWGDDLAHSIEVVNPAGAIVGFGETDGQTLLELRGRVIGESTLPDAIRLLDPGKGMVITLETNADARLTRGGQPIAFEDLEQGDEVRASCQLSRGECTLGTLELSPRNTYRRR